MSPSTVACMMPCTVPLMLPRTMPLTEILPCPDFFSEMDGTENDVLSVSYTHLDVYKRQVKEPRHWRGSSAIIEEKRVRLENWRKNSRRDIVMVDVDALVPKDHLLRKIENEMDYEWLYARLSPYYCADNGRPGSDPVVLIKMVLLQHLYGCCLLYTSRCV